MTNLVLNTQNSTPYNTAINTSIRMTSQEIADLVESRHDDVKRSIERLVTSGVIVQPPMADEQSLDTLGRSRTTKVYVFEGEQGKRDTMVIVAQLSPQFLGTVVDRWLELERAVQQPQFALPTTFSQALLLAAQLEEQKEQLSLQVAQQQQVIEVMQPTVDAYDLIAGKRGSMCFQDAYKFLGGMKLKDMKKWLFDKKWMYKDRFDRDAISYAYQVNGYLVVKATAHQPQIRIKYRGLAAMARQMKIELKAEDFT